MYTHAIHTCICMCMCVYMHMCVYVCVCTHAYIPLGLLAVLSEGSHIVCVGLPVVEIDRGHARDKQIHLHTHVYMYT